MFRTTLCPPSGASQLHMQSLVPCGSWFVLSSRTGGHKEPSTTRDQRLHAHLRSSWWWTQRCPKHVERNNVNKILRILKQSTSSWRFIQVITTMYGTMNLKLRLQFAVEHTMQSVITVIRICFIILFRTYYLYVYFGLVKIIGHSQPHMKT